MLDYQGEFPESNSVFIGKLIRMAFRSTSSRSLHGLFMVSFESWSPIFVVSEPVCGESGEHLQKILCLSVLAGLLQEWDFAEQEAFAQGQLESNHD